MNDIIINNKIFEPYIKYEQVQAIISNLANRINQDYMGKEIIFLVVLKGAMFFAVDLFRKLTVKHSIEVVSAKSYGASMTSSGQVNLNLLGFEAKDKHVVIVEDIVDTGNTIKVLIDNIKLGKPASVEVVALVSKPAKREVDVNCKYIGLEIEPVFIVGYGLDYAEQGRSLTDIYAHFE